MVRLPFYNILRRDTCQLFLYYKMQSAKLFFVFLLTFERKRDIIQEINNFAKEEG